jgi:hypothetical protein
MLKERARCYGHGNARDVENETIVKKKRLPKILYYKKQLQTWLILINQNYEKFTNSD